jgi:hypothetical protein
MAKKGKASSPNHDRDDLVAELDRLVRLAVEQIREPVRELEEGDRIISRHYDYPKLGRFDSGQPKVNHGDGPIDYSDLFKFGEPERWYASFDQVPAFRELGEIAQRDRSLRARLLLPGVEEMTKARDRMLLIGSAQIPLEIFDRLMNTVGSEFTEEDVEAAWEPLRNGLLWERLPVELVIPVCLTTFAGSDRVVLDEQARLEPLSDEEQLARVPEKVWFGAANDCVVGAATHAVCLAGFEFEGDQRMTAHYGGPAFYPGEQIGLVFEALRIGSVAPLGYAQIFMRPLGWAWDYKADLAPIIQGSIARQYPPSFDDYGWLRKPQIVSEEEVSSASLALRHLRSANKRLRLASRRLSSAALRVAEEDAVLDLCIALEAALGDRQRSEMTYKLSMRAAALLAADRNKAAQWETVRRVKALYGWRSAIVHGDEVVKAREKFVGGGDGAAALEVATALVREVLMALVRHPEVGDSGQIDALMLQGGNAGAAGSETASGEPVGPGPG